MGRRSTVAKYRVATAIARRLPGAVRRRVPGIASALTPILLRPSTRALLLSHQRRLAPSASDEVVQYRARGMVASYARYWVDTLRLPFLDEVTAVGSVSVEGYEHVERALAAGRGAILALPHLGGWEWAGRWLASRGVEVVSVVERLEPPELLDWFGDLRASLGIRVHPAGPEVVAELRGVLDRNGVVCLLSDRDVTGGGYEVDFLGEVTRLPAGPAVLALRSGAPLLPTAVYQTDAERHLGVVAPPIDCERREGFRGDTARIMGDLAEALGGLIRSAPEQWHLFQPNWPSDPGWSRC